ncbi:DsbA family oxidoreductase [Oceaniglobus indicus]|uniref:DsbA family oxidoreductase n=1 Tax=Oceaniglobus indicus TaxID=2047749 RepID=UPI000C1A5561|nr:DsbA family oxidoreductase [Oceaniglobus indicus]
MQTVKLDILSDPICPWCFIGKTYLDRALIARPDHPFVLEWHPFQLNPDMPPQGMDRRAYLEAKFGGRDEAVRAYAPIEKTAAAVGIDIDWAAITRTPNTLNAHRLIHWAGLEQRQTFAVDRLFKAYFQEGRDIGDTAVLVDIADGIGMDAAVTERLLAGDADSDDIRARDAHTRKRGVTGVPTFIVASTHALPGAQPTDLWNKVLDDLEQQMASPGPDDVIQ